MFDLGSPKKMVGLTAFVKEAGGGRCANPECRCIVAQLLPDGKCARCSTYNPITGKPCGQGDECRCGGCGRCGDACKHKSK